nr:hypothetical protein [Deltaproteobacteria bacterium]
MLRRSLAAALLLSVAVGCATASERDGTFNDRDAGETDLGDPKDTSPGKKDAVEEAPEDVPATPDAPDAGAATRDAPEASVDAPIDRPTADIGDGTCAEGTTRPCYTGLPTTRHVGLCGDGFQRCVGGRWGVECNGETRPQVEECNTIDDDCDGTVDNIQTITCYTGPPGTRAVGICHEGMRRCDGAMAPRCIGQVVPETREVCANGRDDNCNGMTDEAGCL